MTLKETVTKRKLALEIADIIFKDAVVTIISKSNGEFEQGSGVVLNGGKILTAAHVVTDSINGIPSDEVMVCIDKPKNLQDCLPVTVVSIQIGKAKDYVDLALLESRDAKGHPYATLTLKAPAVGDKVTLKGYDGRYLGEEKHVAGKVVEKTSEYIKIEPGLFMGASGGGAFKGNELQGIISTMQLNQEDFKKGIYTPDSQKVITPRLIRAFLNSGLPDQYNPSSKEGKKKIGEARMPEIIIPKQLPTIYLPGNEPKK